MLITILIGAFRSRRDAKSRPCIHNRNRVQQEATTEPGEETLKQIDCPECKAEASAARKYRWRLALCLIPLYTLQSLDVTMVASALPWIALEFGEIAQLNWIVSAFSLASAAFTPFWGQMADILGRHYALQICSFIMIAGSALCVGAPTTAFGAFLLGRALLGVGCAGLTTIIRIILADKVSPEENAKTWSLFSSAGGLCYGLGPLFGGYLTADNWRWCFGINLPIAFLGILTVFFFLRKDLLGPQPIPELHETETSSRGRFSRRIATIDIGGQLLFLFGFGLLILALTWAGATYDWNNPAVFVPLIIGTLLSCTWLYYEYSMAEGRLLSKKLHFQRPMLPWHIVENRNVGLLCYIYFVTGMAMYSIFYFVDIYFAIVKGYNSSDAGVQLMYYPQGLAVGLYSGLFLCYVWPRQTFLPLFIGSVVEAIGIGLLAWALYFEQTATICGIMAMAGAGTAFRLSPAGIHAVAFLPEQKSTVMALMSASVTLGGALALTIMSTIFNNTSGITRDSPFQNSYDTSQLPDNIKAQIVNGTKNGITWAFVALTPFMVTCVLATASLGNVTIAKESNDGTPGHHLTHGSYLLSLIRGGHAAKSEDVELDKRIVEEPSNRQSM
ncbi:MFS general substrate transporter [Hypoxylon sp. FL1857]|nr:MFS general substrate transporter [Hypoxylon sp. FL1857]